MYIGFVGGTASLPNNLSNTPWTVINIEVFNATMFAAGKTMHYGHGRVRNMTLAVTYFHLSHSSYTQVCHSCFPAFLVPGSLYRSSLDKRYA